MNEQPKSSGEVHIERIMGELEPGSDRYQVLATAKQFKASWVQLGEKLVRVNSSGMFKDWGYESFEDYCAKEIRIRKPTAQKLTLAYHYMEREEPELLGRKEELKPLPDYRSIDLLRQAKEEKNFTEQEYSDLRKAIVEDERSLPTVQKQFKEVVATHEEPEENPLLHAKAALSAARRLATALRSAQDVPEAYHDQAEAMVAHLEAQVATLEEQAESA